MTYETIPRNHTKRIAEIRKSATKCKVFSLRNDFSGVPIDPEPVWDEYLNRHGVKLVHLGECKYLLEVHANLWFEFTSGKQE